MNRESERERLIELVKQVREYCNKGDCTYCSLAKFGGYPACRDIRLADHLLNDGWIKPPCKIGDTIYFIGGIYNRIIYDAKVEEIYVGNGYAFNVSRGNLTFTLLESEVCFTREEALAKVEGAVSRNDYQRTSIRHS